MLWQIVVIVVVVAMMVMVVNVVLIVMLVEVIVEGRDDVVSGDSYKVGDFYEGSDGFD